MKLIRMMCSVLVLTLCISAFAGCSSSVKQLTKVKVSEVTHSVFYAPQYVALELGYFKDEGLDVEILSGDGADKVMTSLISGAVDIGFSGPEAAIYVYNEGKDDFAKVFAQVTNRDGSFLMAREPDPDFEWSKLAGKHILPGRKGGVPYMTFEYVVKQNGLIPGVDLNFDTSIQFAAMTGAFLGGTGDYVTVFEPTASSIELEGKGYIVASIGEASGEIPYTAYYALNSYIAKNPQVIQSFTNAIAKAQTFVKDNSAEKIAEVIAPQFADANKEVMAKAIENYKAIEAYAYTPVMAEEAFERLQEVMQEAQELSSKAPFDALVDNSFAEKTIG